MVVLGGCGTLRGFGEGRPLRRKVLERLFGSRFPSQDRPCDPGQELGGGSHVGRTFSVSSPALGSRGHCGSGICQMLERSPTSEDRVEHSDQGLTLSGRLVWIHMVGRYFLPARPPNRGSCLFQRGVVT